MIPYSFSSWFSCFFSVIQAFSDAAVDAEITKTIRAAAKAILLKARYVFIKRDLTCIHNENKNRVQFISALCFHLLS